MQKDGGIKKANPFFKKNPMFEKIKDFKLCY